MDKLEFYQIREVKFDESCKYLKKVQDVSQNMGGQDSPKLDIWLKLSMIEGGIPEGMFHIIMGPPAGESIN